jgi:hypothetical protein
MSTGTNAPQAPEVKPPGPRVADAIYQNNQLAARVVGPEIDLEAREIRFQELYNSDDLVLPEECEFDKYTIVVERIGFATLVERGSEHRGRVLKNVVAEILRCQETVKAGV